MSTLKPASFWSGKRDTIVIFVRGFAKRRRVKTSQQHGSSKKAHLPAIRITEQPVLLTKSKINCTGYAFSKYPSRKADSQNSSRRMLLFLATSTCGA